jgi:hypothetical protein
VFQTSALFVACFYTSIGWALLFGALVSRRVKRLGDRAPTYVQNLDFLNHGFYQYSKKDTSNGSYSILPDTDEGSIAWSSGSKG